VVNLAKKVGFVLEASSEINANSVDTKDHPFGVWTLPPIRRDAPSGQPANPNFDHSKYDTIGESDRMTLKLVKPK
jgi:predicted methyltransferase